MAVTPRRQPLTQHVIHFSGGVGSWYAARRTAERHGTENLTLLFADVRSSTDTSPHAGEDEDLYRFLEQAAADVGGRLEIISDGRGVWEVFRDHRFIGNTRVDPCSYTLKRKLLRDWLTEHCDPEHTVCYLGIDWTEQHRFTKAEKYWSPWTVAAPLCEPPYVDKDQMLAALAARGIAPPRLYAMGFPHNNCGGFCVKAGHGQFQLLLEQMPERYRWHEDREQEMRDLLGKDISILRDRTGGTTTPMTLRRFRYRVRGGEQVDQFDLGGCNCVNPDLDADAEIEGRLQ